MRNLVEPMRMETNIHADGWKTGTEALALCMICGGEYEPGTQECPDCKVSLSVVRRCPSCHRIVSAKHTRCVYCRFSFTHELPEGPLPAELAAEGDGGLSAGIRRFRAAAVSIATFVFVFILGLVFLRQINQPAIPVHIIAKSYVLHSAELRHAPSFSSSIAGTVAPGTTVVLTGFRENDQGRWVKLDWNHAVAYLPANDLSAPRAVDAHDGADALKFYLLGMEAAESVDEAVKAVDFYAQAFPADAHGEELRWVLAERVRILSQHGGSQGPALRRQANQQYQQLVASNGKFAEKARDALARVPSAPDTEARPRVSSRKAGGLQVIGGSGTQTSAAKSAAHEVLILTQAEVIVRPGKLSQSAAGTVVTGRVASPVKTNGIVAIPAGALCQLTVVSADPSQAKLSLALSSIEIDHRVYAVKSPAMEIPSSVGDRRSADRALSFHLEAPLVIER
jgi:hypothetical protein